MADADDSQEDLMRIMRNVIRDMTPIWTEEMKDDVKEEMREEIVEDLQDKVENIISIINRQNDSLNELEHDKDMQDEEIISMNDKIENLLSFVNDQNNRINKLERVLNEVNESQEHTQESLKDFFYRELDSNVVNAILQKLDKTPRTEMTTEELQNIKDRLKVLEELKDLLNL